MKLPSGVHEGADVKLLDFFTRPRGFPEELKTGFDARIKVEAANFYDPSQFQPAVVFGKLGHNHLKRDAMQRIFGLRLGHRKTVKTGKLCLGDWSKKNLKF